MRIPREIQYMENAEMRISREIQHVEHVVLKRNAYFSKNTTQGKGRNAYFSSNTTPGPCLVTTNSIKRRISREILYLAHIVSKRKTDFSKNIVHEYVEILYEILYKDGVGILRNWFRMAPKSSERLKMA